MKTWSGTAMVAVGAALLLGGCGGTSTPTTSGRSTTPATSAASSATSSASSSATTTASAAATTAGSDDAVTSADVCTYLTGRLPTLRQIGSPVGVQANLAGNLEAFFEAHGQRPDGQVLDDASSSGCPAVRTEVLKLAGIGSFTAL